MACTFPYIENNFRKTAPETADKLNEIGLSTWKEIKDSNLFRQKDNAFLFNKENTIKRGKQDVFVRETNTKLGGEVITNTDNKVSVNVLPIADLYLPKMEIQPMVEPTIQKEVYISQDKNDWDQFKKISESNSIGEVLFLTKKFQGFESLSDYDKVFGGKDPQAFGEYANKTLETTLQKFTELQGIGIKDISEYQQQYFERTGKLISASGVADLINKTIYVAEGNVDALTEEVSHFIVAMLPKNSPFYMAIDAYLENTPEFSIYYDAYLKAYNNDSKKAREEVMGKVVKNTLLEVKEKMPLSLKSLVKSILDYINNIFGSQKNDFKRATANIKQMFFSENLVEVLGDLDTSSEELYQLTYSITGDAIGGNNIINQSIIEEGLNNIFGNTKKALEEFREKAKETGNNQGVLVASKILKKINETSTKDLNKDVVLVDIINTISSQLNYIIGGFNKLNNENTKISDFFNKGGQFSREEMSKLQSDEYSKRLKQIGSYINYIQSLKDFGQIIGDLKTIITSSDYNTKEFYEIISLLDPRIQENSLFQASFELLNNVNTIDLKISKINAIYDDNSKTLVKGLLDATTTADQKAFMEKANIDALTEKSPITNEINKDKLSFIKKIGLFFLPTTMQSNIMIQNANNFVNFVLRKGQEESDRVATETLGIQKELFDAGVKDQEWVSAKDKDGNISFKLLTKFNYTNYYKEATIHLQQIAESKLKFLPEEIYKKLLNDKFYSSRELFEVLTQAFTDNKLEEEDYNRAFNYLNAQNNLYNLKRFVPNASFTGIERQNLQNFIDNSTRIYEEFLGDDSYDWSSEHIMDVINSEINFYDLQDALDKAVENKRELLIKKYVTFDPATTSAEENPIYKNQLERVRGLLNFYKNNIGYVVDDENNIIPSEIKFNKWGDEFLFSLKETDENGNVPSYVDKEYVQLEKDAANPDSENYKQAVAKLKMINYIKDFNIAHNKSSNSLDNVVKRENEYNTLSLKFLGKRITFSDFITNFITPLGLSIALPSLLFGDGVFDLSYFLSLPIGGQITSFILNIGLANVVFRAIDIFSNKASRELKSPKDVISVLKIAAQTLGILSDSYIIDLFKSEQEQLRGDTETEKANNLFKKIYTKIYKFLFNKKEKEQMVPYTYSSSNKIPLLFNKYVKPELRSTQFIDNFKEGAAATYDYEAKVDFEGTMKAMDNIYKKVQSNVNTNSILNTVNYFENVYLNRIWYGKIYSNSKFNKFVNILTGLTSRMFLSGNVLSAIKNVLFGLTNNLIKGGPLLAGKSGAQAIMYSLRMSMYAATNDKVAIEQEYIQQLKKRMRTEYKSGIYEQDMGSGVLSRKLRLKNAQMLNALGESFISSMISYMMINSHKLVDENGNRYDIAKHTEFNNGRLEIKKGAPAPYFNFLNKSQQSQLSADDLTKINLYKLDRSILSDEGKKILNNTSTEINNYLNVSFLQNLDYFRQRTQGVYNSIDKPILATHSVGRLFYQFSNHLASMYTTSLGAKKQDIALGETTEGFIITTVKMILNALKSSIRKGGNKLGYFEEQNPEMKNSKNINQLYNLTDFVSINEYSLIKELKIMSGVQKSDWDVKQIKQLASDIVTGKIKTPFFVDGKSDFTEEVMFTLLYSKYLDDKALNSYKSKNIASMATFLGVTYLLTKLTKAFYSDDDDETSMWQKFISGLSATMSLEMITNYSGLGILQKVGVDFSGFFNQLIYGKETKEPTNIQPLKGIVVWDMVSNRIKDLAWFIAAGYHNLFNTESLLYYNEEQTKNILKIYGDENLPLTRTKFVIQSYGKGKKYKKLKEEPVDIVKEDLLDILLTPGYRDIYKRNLLKKDYYEKLPNNTIEIWNYKLKNNFYRQTGRQIIDFFPEETIKEEEK